MHTCSVVTRMHAEGSLSDVSSTKSLAYCIDNVRHFDMLRMQYPNAYHRCIQTKRGAWNEADVAFTDASKMSGALICN